MKPMIFRGNVNQVYPPLVESIIYHGQEVCPRGTVTLELNPAILGIVNPRHRFVSSYNRIQNVAFCLAEELWILSGRRDVEFLKIFNSQISKYSDDGQVFNAAYGYRLRHWPLDGHSLAPIEIDQLEDIIRCLETDPDTRQASLVISDPRFDSSYGANGKKRETKDRACNVYAHAMIRNGALNWLQVLRSNDVIWGVPTNFMQWTFIMEYVAARLGVSMGTFTMISDSMHIYTEGESAKHFEEAKGISYFNLYEELGYEPLPMPYLRPERVRFATEDAYNIVKAKFPLTMLGQVEDRHHEYLVHMLEILACYAEYRLRDHTDPLAGRNIMARTADCQHRVYGAALCKFMWQMRYKGKVPEKYENAIYDDLVNAFGHSVAEWVFQD